MDVQLIKERDAETCLGHGDFAKAWNALYDVCPWAAGYQSLGFARAWYASYADAYAPLLVLAEDQAGDLAGLLALAQHRAAGSLVNAGDAPSPSP